MDYDYHAFYRPERQLLHDQLIDAFLLATVVQDRWERMQECEESERWSCGWMSLT